MNFWSSIKYSFAGLLMLVITSSVYSQEVEHNYTVGSQVTDCDSLQISDLSVEDAIESIISATYRFQQSFRLTRRQGFKGGEYFSCDGEVGYLILNYNDEQLLFIDVKKSTWESLIHSPDPEGYFLDNKKELIQFER